MSRLRPSRAALVCLLLPGCLGPAPSAAPAPAATPAAVPAAAREVRKTASQGDLELRQEPGNASAVPAPGPTLETDAGDLCGTRRRVLKLEAAQAREALKVTFSQQPKRFWDVELIAHALEVKRGAAYKVTFWAKADAARSIYFDVSHDGPPYSALGISTTLRVGPEWKRHELVFLADGSPYPHGRAVFKLGQTAEPVWIAGFSFAPAAPNEVPVVDPAKVIDPSLPPALEAQVRKTIEEVRQGAFAVAVLDSHGKPVRDAQVKVRLKRHAFLFGQTLPHGDWSAPRRSPWQEKFLALWEPVTTLVVPENSTKGGQWNRSTVQARSIWELARERGLAFKSHAPIWGFEYEQWRKRERPRWDCAAIEADVLKRLREQLTMFKGHHAYSDLANEMVSAPFIQDACGGEAKLIEWYKLASEIDPALKLVVNDYEQMRGRGTRVDDLVGRFKAAGVAVAAQGEQFHDRNMWYPPDEVWAMLDRIGRGGVEVHLTELTQPDDQANILGDYVTGAVWSSANQAAWLRQTYRLAFGHPAVAAIVMWNFWDGSTWLRRGGIVERDFKPKPAYQALHDLITKEWTTDLSLATDASGTARGRGFWGSYEVTVTARGKTQTVSQTLAKTAGAPEAWTVRLP